MMYKKKKREENSAAETHFKIMPSGQKKNNLPRTIFLSPPKTKQVISYATSHGSASLFPCVQLQQQKQLLTPSTLFTVSVLPLPERAAIHPSCNEHKQSSLVTPLLYSSLV